MLDIVHDHLDKILQTYTQGSFFDTLKEAKEKYFSITGKFDEDKDEFEFEVIGSEFKQQDKTIYVLGRLLSALKPNPIMPLVSTNMEKSEETLELPKFSSESDQKLVTIIPSQQEPDKKKRKLKKPSIDNVKIDEPSKEGMA